MLSEIKHQERVIMLPEQNQSLTANSVMQHHENPFQGNVSAAVVARDLVRVFGQKVAVNHLNLTVQRGEFFGFLGPNGAGKSTTIKMLTGLLRPTSGPARILGLDLARDSVEIKRRIGVVPEGLARVERLTGAQLRNVVRRMDGLVRAKAARRIA